MNCSKINLKWIIRKKNEFNFLNINLLFKNKKIEISFDINQKEIAIDYLKLLIFKNEIEKDFFNKEILINNWELELENISDSIIDELIVFKKNKIEIIFKFKEEFEKESIRILIPTTKTQPYNDKHNRIW